MIELRVSRSGKKTEEWLRKISQGNISADLSRFGQEGVRALSAATPIDTGLSSISWGYRVVKTKRGFRIEWYNTDLTANGTPVVILVHYGHASRSGAYVAGRDFINPAIRPVLDRISKEIWEKVKNG